MSDRSEAMTNPLVRALDGQCTERDHWLFSVREGLRPPPNKFECDVCLHEALRAAYRSGQEEMRERVALSFRGENHPMPCEVDMCGYCISAAHIRALPLADKEPD